MATKTSRKKSTTTAKSPARKTRSAKRVTSSIAKTAQRTANLPIGKAAAKVLAGATAGAVRAIIPQLEEAAGMQEKVAGSQPKGKSTRAPRG